MIKIEKKYRCIFCGLRKSYGNSYYDNGLIGICPDCFSKLEFVTKPQILRGTRNVDYLVSPILYSGKMRDVIIDYKFNGNSAYGDILSYLLRSLIQNFEHLSEFDYIFPVPLSKNRFNERGYNQAALLAKPLSECFSVPYSEDILRKIKETKRQSSLSGAERFRNVAGAYKAFEDLTGKRVLLVDDIFTSGNTLSSCADALKHAGTENVAAVTLTVKEKFENIFNIMY